MSDKTASLYGLPESEREGVFVNGFKCGVCALEFSLYSWKADRHRVGTVGCPECGNRVWFFHWRATLSDAPKMILTSSAEIFNHFCGFRKF